MIIILENTTVVVKRFDPLQATKDEWALYHEFRKEKHKEETPDDPVSNDSSFETAIKTNVQYPEAEIYLYSIIDSKTNKQIGDVDQVTIREVSPSYEAAKHLLQFSIYLLPGYRRQGIGTKVLRMLVDEAKKRNKVLLMTGSENDDGKAFLQRIGAQTALAGLENRLVLSEVNWTMLDDWIVESKKKTPTTTIEAYTTIPEEIIEDYCKIYTEVINQQPLGELDVGAMITTPESYRQQEKMFADMGRTWLTIITRESDGTISGLTEVRYNPAKATLISQGMTGVQEKHRGKGLGKLLKASMLQKIKTDFPEVKIVSTGNATTNAPMLSINTRLGFKKHKETISAQISVEALDQFLSH